ncbi:MAG: hypothetical protein JSR39_09670 [Verrucomicrobia bacterium]|nr:hypothetical protein [Verrucomicrobiota bacterium]
MNFTREPIIETIISPKDGFKLLVRSSKAGSSEEYFVDAVEVVSFGRAFFFRSLERPKAFLVPASDYEVLEVKETRVALKNVSHERSIKIGGGREAPVRHREREPQVVKEKEEESASAEEASTTEGETVEVTAAEPRMDRRRDRRRHRRRRQSDDQEWSDRNKGHEQQPREAEAPKSDAVSEGGGAQDEVKTSSSMFSSLFPPPPTLISETLSRYKDKEASENAPSAPAQEEARQEEPPAVKKKEKEDDTGSESAPLHRVHAQEEIESFTTTHFSPLQGGEGFNQFF